MDSLSFFVWISYHDYASVEGRGHAGFDMSDLGVLEKRKAARRRGTYECHATCVVEVAYA